MNALTHIVEPSALLLTWQPMDECAPKRTRRVVGKVQRDSLGHLSFRYLKDSDDFREAEASGFRGYPAFPLTKDEVHEGVDEALTRRLPPRKREDFVRYLAQHQLPTPFEHSDLALLGYTGAYLPSDGFGLVPVFPTDSREPCDLVVEVAGLRHTFGGDPACIHVGDEIRLQADPQNPVDQDAVLVTWNGQRLGYINRALRDTFKAWISSRSVTATVDRVNGKPDRPLVYLRVAVR